MTKIYFDIESYVEVTREHDETDRWSGEDTDTTWDFKGAYLQKPRDSGEVFETSFDVAAGDTVYAVFAVWSDGDSFSRHDNERSEIFGVFDNEQEALKLKYKLENAAHGGTYGKRGEYLEYVKVYERTVNDRAN